MSWRDNPEFVRLAWLDLTLARLVAMPMVLGLMLALALMNGVDGGTIGAAALMFYVLLTYFIGLRQAAEAVAEEFRERTWDAQRMSAMTPATLALGKLAGASLFMWYGGAFCLATFAVSAAGSLGMANLAWSVALLVGGALLMQSLGMLAALLSPGVRSLRLPYLLLLGLVMLPALGTFYPLISGAGGTALRWYGLAPPALPFACLSVWAYALWCVAGVVQRMATELQVRSTPALWCAFLAFGTLHASGFFIHAGTPARAVPVFIALAGCAAFALGAVLAAWFDRGDLMRFKRLARAWNDGRRRRFAEELPAWAAALAAAVLLAALLVPGLAAVAPSGAAFGPLASVGRSTVLLPLTIVLAACRDIVVLQGLSLTRGPQRGDLPVLLYLLLAWVLLPALFELFGLRFLVLPDPLREPGLAAAIFAGHACVAIAWLLARWRRLVAA